MNSEKNNLKEIFAFECHSDIVYYITFSPDGTIVLSGSDDGTVKLLDLSTHKILQTFYHEAPIKALTFAENGRRIITFSDDKIIHIWDSSSLEKIEEFPILGPKTEHYKGRLGHKYILSAAFSPDGRYILAGCQDKVVYLLPVSPGARSRRLIGHKLPVLGVGFTRKDGPIYSFSQWPDTTLRLWDTETRKEVQCLNESDHILCAIVSPDGHYAVTGLVNGKVHVWNVLNGRLLFNLSPVFLKKETLVSLDFHKDNRRLLVGTFEGIISLWDLETKKKLATSKAHEGPVNQVIISPNGHFALSCGGKEHSTKFWELPER